MCCYRRRLFIELSLNSNGFRFYKQMNRKREDNMKYKIAILLSLFLANIVFADPIKTISPYYGTIQKSFTEPAKTRLENIYSINMPVSGRLERIMVKEGTEIKKGQIVARLVQEPLVQAVKKAESFLHTIKLSFISPIDV